MNMKRSMACALHSIALKSTQMEKCTHSMKRVTKVPHHPLQAFSSWFRCGISALLVLYGVLGAAQSGRAQKQGVLPDAPQQRNSQVRLPPAGSSSSDEPIPDNPLPSPQARLEDKLDFQTLNRRQKFVFATDNAFGIPSVFFAAAGAGVNQSQNLYPEFHQGAPGYARYYWHSFADQAVDSYAVNFLLPAVLHQDPRYHPLREGGVWKRTAYSLSRLLVTRSDSGAAEFNTSQVLGSGVAASISSLYYPQQDRTMSLVGQRWLSNMTGDGLLMVLNEFAPDFGRTMKHLATKIPYYSAIWNQDDSAEHSTD